MGEVEEGEDVFNCIRIVGESGGKRRGFVILYFCSLTTVGIWLILLLMILAKAMVYNMDLLGQVTV